MSQIVRIHASSGTTGKPTVVGYTRKDLSTWSECLSRAFTAYGADSSDIFKYLMVTDSLPVGLVLMRGLKILGRPSFLCQAEIRKTNNVDA